MGSMRGRAVPRTGWVRVGERRAGGVTMIVGLAMSLAALAGACGSDSGAAVGTVTSPEPTAPAGSAGSGAGESPGSGGTVTTETGPDEPSTTVASSDGEPIDWTTVDFHNFTFDLGGPDNRRVTPVDGEVTEGEIGDEDYIYFAVTEVLYGDLGGPDGDEAVVSIFFTTGGTGQFSDVHVFGSVDGEVGLLDRAGVGDRAIGGIETVTLDNGEVDLVRLGGEGACCADRVVYERLRLQDGRLSLVEEPVEAALLYVSTTNIGVPELKFLPGGVSAAVKGDAAGAFTTLDAGQGQRLTVSVADGSAADAVVVVDETSGLQILDVAVGTEGTVTLPASGFYTLEAITASESVVVDVEVTIV